MREKDSRCLVIRKHALAGHGRLQKLLFFSVPPYLRGSISGCGQRRLIMRRRLNPDELLYLSPPSVKICEDLWESIFRNERRVALRAEIRHRYPVA